MTEEEFKNLHLQLANEDIRKVDEWKSSHGMKSRTEAIRAMIRMVTSGHLEENNSGFGEKEKSTYMKPTMVKPDEETIRKIVKEELQKRDK